MFIAEAFECLSKRAIYKFEDTSSFPLVVTPLSPSLFLSVSTFLLCISHKSHRQLPIAHLCLPVLYARYN